MAFVTLLLVWTIIPASAALPRFAVCVSGGARTLEHTVGRFASLLDRNPDTDFFFVLGLEDNRGRVEIKGATKKFLQRREVVNTTFVSDTWNVAQRVLKVACPDPERERMGSVINQAYKILQCQRLIEYHTATHRGGTEYDLVLRLRPDVLLPPEPLELSKAASIVQHTLHSSTLPSTSSAVVAYNKRLLALNEASAPVEAAANTSTRGSLAASGHIGEKSPLADDASSLLQVEANWAAKSAAAPPKTQALVVPLCCDWNGLNDQIALGTQGAMRDYASRYFTWKKQHPAMLTAAAKKHGCEGDSDRHTLLVAQAHMDTTLVLRFSFDYALLREKNVPHFLASPDTYRGEPRKVSSKSADFLYCFSLIWRLISQFAFTVSAGANGFNHVVNLGTYCSDPQLVQGAQLLRRQRETSGQSTWTLDDLKCTLITRDHDDSSGMSDSANSRGVGAIRDGADVPPGSAKGKLRSGKKRRGSLRNQVHL